MNLFLFTCFVMKERLPPQAIEPGVHRSRCPRDVRKIRIAQTITNTVTLVTFFIFFPLKNINVKGEKRNARLLCQIFRLNNESFFCEFSLYRSDLVLLYCCKFWKSINFTVRNIKKDELVLIASPFRRSLEQDWIGSRVIGS